MKLRLRITAKDIRLGSPSGMHGPCAIKLALIRATDTYDCGVGCQIIRIKDKNYRLPNKAINFIYCFDYNDKHGCKPFQMTVELDE